MALRDLGPWRYTADDSTVYVRRADKFITAQGTGDPVVPYVGGESGAGAAPYRALPRSIRPRGLYCSGSGGYKAFVVIYDKAVYEAALATPITLNVRDGGGTSHSVTSYKGRPERGTAAIGPGQ
jgi:hypothetical protein